MPASVMPIASTTAMQPSGMASIAVRVEIGDDHDSGVARSSRAGTKRNVKPIRPAAAAPAAEDASPQPDVRRPFFSRTV